MKVTVRYLDCYLEINTEKLLYVEFALDDGKTFKVGLDKASYALNIHCDGQLVIQPEASNRVYLDEG